MRVAFVAAEVVPFAKTGGLGDVCGTLPLALEREGITVDVFMPGYGCIDRKAHGFKRLDNVLSYKKISRLVTVYLIESNTYFGRKGLYGSKRGEYKDNLERFHYFNAQTLRAIKRLGHPVDVIHGHDWHAGLIPAYLKELHQNDPFFKKTKTLLTIHNLAFQGLFAKKKFSILGLNKHLFNMYSFEFYGKGNLLKAGIVYADGVNTVSPRYAKEIQSHQFGCGLEGVLKHHKHKLGGILNGIDEQIWNPKIDSFIPARFDGTTIAAAKEINKQRLLKKLGLPFNKDIPLYGSVGRLSHQKGMDLILDSLDQIMAKPLVLIVQGVGDTRYEKGLSLAAKKYKGRFVFIKDFNEVFAHQVYAASDFFLMPSTFEPCGLSQMISMKYATVPVVHKTGGLADTVRSIEASRSGNGINFSRYNRAGFLKALQVSLKLFQNKKRLFMVRRQGMKSDFTWKRSAKEYKRVYRCL